MSVHCETRVFPDTEQAMRAYVALGGRLAAQQGPGCSAFLAADADSLRGIVSVLGDDEAKVRAEGEQLGGERIELPQDIIDAMDARRGLVDEIGVPFTGFVYDEPAVLRPDGRMEPWE